MAGRRQPAYRKWALQVACQPIVGNPVTVAGHGLEINEDEMNLLPITGYLDRFSHRPGESFTAHIGMREPGAYRARLVRVISGDPNPQGPGLRFEELPQRFDQSFTGRRQEIRLGSYGIVEQGPRREAGSSTAWTWTVQVRTQAPEVPATLIAEESEGRAVILATGPTGTEARLAWPGGELRLTTHKPLLASHWYRLWLGVDTKTGHVVLGQQPLGEGARSMTSAQAPGLSLPSEGTVLIAAERVALPHRHFPRRTFLQKSCNTPRPAQQLEDEPKRPRPGADPDVC